MIFVMVGTHSKPFDRLLHAADEFAATTDEQVVMQTGVSSFEPKHADHFAFTDQRGMDEWLNRARVIVTHGGAGSVLSALKHGKPLIVVPRRREFGEHQDDHQKELALALLSASRISLLWDATPDALQGAIRKVRPCQEENTRVLKLVHSVQDQLYLWEEGNHISTGKCSRGM